MDKYNHMTGYENLQLHCEYMGYYKHGSIENQSLVLHEYAASMPEALNAEIMEFIDNGYSGTNFERPQVQKLIELVRANQIDCIIVKDYCAIIGLNQKDLENQGILA